MAYRSFCIHDVIEDDTGDEPIGSQIIYVDFDTEDEAYRFGSLAAESDALRREIERLAKMACEQEDEA